MKKVIETKIQKRFADVDVFRHVNNIHQQEYLDLGKTDYYEQVIGFDVLADRVTLVIVSVKSDFAVQIRYSDTVFVRTWVEHIGTKSITIRQQIVSRKVDGEETVCTEYEPGIEDAISPTEACNSPQSDGADITDGGNNERIHTECQSVLVCFDRRDQVTVELPAEWREKIER